MSKEQDRGPLYGKVLSSGDGQTRITRSKDFFCSGGNQEQHERLVEVVAKTEEGLKKDGKSLRTVEGRELTERIAEQIEKTRR